MKYEELIELKKRIDFNLTEPEVLVKLIESARQRGEEVKGSLARFRQLSMKIANFLYEKGFIIKEDALKDIELFEKRAIGIDGSFQVVGGTGGIWYAPISVARVLFDNGLHSKSKVDVYWADIEVIIEKGESNPEKDASQKMLVAETKAIFNWCTRDESSFIFIDGPVVDPPFGSSEDYIKFRCEAIKKCLDKSIMIGCVKRSRDKFFIEHIKAQFTDIEQDVRNALDDFLTDQHIMLFVFAHIRRKEQYNGPLFTKWIDLSSVNDIYKAYKECGVHIISLFFQKSLASPVLRLDIPLLDPSDKDHKVQEIVLQAVKAVNSWIYPGQEYPLPVMLAHEKCKIREGCAQVLYEEIITKGYVTGELEQLVLSQIR